MNASLRACIASIAARATDHTMNSSVYDHSQGKHVHVSGDASTDAVNVYDHDRSRYVTGTLPSLYDHAGGRYISLDLNGTQFSGYDHASGRYYSGNISGNSVTIYDHETGRHHHYSV